MKARSEGLKSALPPPTATPVAVRPGVPARRPQHPGSRLQARAEGRGSLRVTQHPLTPDAHATLEPRLANETRYRDSLTGRRGSSAITRLHVRALRVGAVWRLRLGGVPHYIFCCALSGVWACTAAGHALESHLTYRGFIDRPASESSASSESIASEPPNALRSPGSVSSTASSAGIASTKDGRVAGVACHSLRSRLSQA